MVKNIITRSKNDDNRTLYNLASKNLLIMMPPLAIKDHGKAVKSGYNNAVQNEVKQNLSNLKKQNTITNHLRQVIRKYRLESWHKQIQNLPPNIFPF